MVYIHSNEIAYLKCFLTTFNGGPTVYHNVFEHVLFPLGVKVDSQHAWEEHSHEHKSQAKLRHCLLYVK